jgi:beta-lactamase regulating signal transducer with metallopeptidase domain
MIGMIDWLYQSTIDISILIALILVIRNPVRRFLGAHISYALWSLPLIRLLISNKFERPDVITRYLKVPETNDIIPVYSGPIQANESQIEIITVIWLLGFVTWCTVKLIHGYQFRNLLQKYAQTIPNDSIIPANLLEKFKPKIPIKLSTAVTGPLITGLFKPTIYLPQNFSEVYDEKQRCYIIEHELTHAKRLDLWAQFLAEIFKALFWFNPLVHLAWTKFQQDQELACDRQVLKSTDSQTRYVYGEALKKGLSVLLTPNSLTFFNHKHERFIMLTKHKKNIFTTLAGLTFIAVIGFVVFTKTGVSFTEKSIDTHGGIVSFEFNDIALDAVAMLIADANGGASNLLGLDLLKGTQITAEADKVHAFDFFDTLLKDNGFKVDRNGDTWQFSQL